MLPFEWNALRVGDHVAVHDDEDPRFALRDGVVKLVQTRRGATNEVGIRIEGPARIVRPRRLAVHMVPPDRRYVCWRCDAIAA